MDITKEKTPNSIGRLVKLFFERFKPDPLTAKRFERFMEIKRARISLIVVVVLYLISLFAELFVSNRPLVMVVDGKLYFPTYSKMLYADDFNFKVGDELEVSYRDFAKEGECGKHRGRSSCLGVHRSTNFLEYSRT